MADALGWIGGGLVLATWLYLAVGRGRFWRTSIRLPRQHQPDRWPSVVAIVAARNEAALLPETLPTLLGQRYDGEFRVIVVDDDSDDGTGDMAASLGAEVVRGSGPPPGWTGKVAAQAAGRAVAGEPDYLLLTDADIAYPPDELHRLVSATTANDLVLTSQMARLRAESFWERAIVPAFVYFFAQLYPFARVNGPGRTAAAAGGCMLVDRRALDAAGGLAQIKNAIIDDVALGQLLKRQGRIWLGLSAEVASVRPYPKLTNLWHMIARSAYTQLHYSPALLVGTVAGLAFTYLLPPAITIAALATGAPFVAVPAAAAWLIMTATVVPMLRFYRLGPWRALTLPAVAVLYGAMTIDSAWRHRAGRGAQWKDRVAAP